VYLPCHIGGPLFLSVHVFGCTGLLALDVSTTLGGTTTQLLAVHPVHDAEDIRKWGVHSLRVGACVTLHAMGFSTLDIQWVLRWRSTAFMVYLRNVAILGIRHNAALDRAAAQPFL